jgi:hypothetical protein
MGAASNSEAARGHSSDRDAICIIDLLDLRSLVGEEIRDEVVGIKLGDLTLDFCIKQVEQRGGAELCHRRLIDGYTGNPLAVADENGPKALGSGECAALWSDVLVDEGYVHANLARHLVGCGYQGEKELHPCFLTFARQRGSSQSTASFR